MIGYLRRWRTQGVAQCSTTCRSSRIASFLNVSYAVWPCPRRVYFKVFNFVSHKALLCSTSALVFVTPVLLLFMECCCDSTELRKEEKTSCTIHINWHLIYTGAYPLNLSILLSGGKETNLDSLSSGEWRGRCSNWKSVDIHWVVVFAHCAVGIGNWRTFWKKVK